MIVYEGPTETQRFAAIVVRSALAMYIRTGMKANRSYTPANMRAFVGRLTGHKYARGRMGLVMAYEDLGDWLEKSVA